MPSKFSSRANHLLFHAVNLVALALFLLLVLSVVPAQGAGWAVDLVFEDESELAEKLVQGIHLQIEKRDDVSQNDPGASHHLRVLVRTLEVGKEDVDTSLSLSLTTVLMIKQRSTGLFVPIHIDSAAGFCNAVTIQTCVMSAIAKIDSALLYSKNASALISSLAQTR